MVMNDFLVTTTRSTRRLLAHLDDDEELPVQIVKRMRDFAVALLDGTITPVAIDKEWADLVTLGPADRAYLEALVLQLDVYPNERPTDG
jgi:hypothetical protein